MSKCPELQYKDGGLLSYEYICKITGKVVGNEYDKVKIKNLCYADYSSCFYDCPLYKQKHG